MPFEQNFISYLAVFDGVAARDFAEVEQLFDAVFDGEVFEIDGSTINKNQLRQIHEICLKLKSKAMVMNCDSDAKASATFKVLMVNSRFEIVIDVVGDIEDGKIVRAKTTHHSFNSNILALISVENKLQVLSTIFDGTVKSHRVIEQPFEDFFHDDFVNSFGVGKDGMRYRIKFLLSFATKVELVHFRTLDDSHFEVSIHFQNSIADFTVHSKGTLKDGKLIKLEVYDDAKHEHKKMKEMFGLFSLLQKIKMHEQIQNNVNSSLKDVEESFDNVFHDEMEAEFDNYTVGKAEMKRLVLRDRHCGAKNHVEKIGILDESHIEVVFAGKYYGQDRDGMQRHQLFSIQDEKVIKIESVDEDSAKTPAVTCRFTQQNHMIVCVHNIEQDAQLLNDCDSHEVDQRAAAPCLSLRRQLGKRALFGA